MVIDMDDVIAEQSPESRAYIARRSQEIVIVDRAQVELRAS